MYPEEKTAYPTTQTHFPFVFIPAPLQKQQLPVKEKQQLWKASVYIYLVDPLFLCMLWGGLGGGGKDLDDDLDLDLQASL